MDREQDLLAQADALMQRHRRFVAAPKSPPQPTATLAESGEETLPVLTEVVADEPPAPALPAEAFADLLRPWLARALPEALAQVSPALIEALLARMPEELAQLSPQPPAEDPAPSQQGSL